jgi:hypothetical protein
MAFESLMFFYTYIYYRKRVFLEYICCLIKYNYISPKQEYIEFYSKKVLTLIFHGIKLLTDKTCSSVFYTLYLDMQVK